MSQDPGSERMPPFGSVSMAVSVQDHIILGGWRLRYDNGEVGDKFVILVLIFKYNT